MTVSVLRYLKDQINLRFASTERALEIQSKEVARRLDFLNGEAERLRSMQATYLPREVYEAQQLEIRTQIGRLQQFQANMTGRMAVIAVVIGLGAGLLGTIIGAAVSLWMK